MRYLRPLLTLVSSFPMLYIRPLQQLRQQLEDLTDNLAVCRNPKQRRELLKRMKYLIDETDQLISVEVLHLNTNQDPTNQA